MKVYKIRDTATGLYSCGGHDPRWTKKGKTWGTLGQVKAAMTNFKTYAREPIPETWELVTLTIAEDEDPLPIRMLMGDK